MAYGSTFAEEQSYCEAIWHERAASGAAGHKVITIVAEANGRLVGMATGVVSSAETQGKSRPIIVGVFVDSTVRRHGVGVAMIEKVIEWARARGSTHVDVWITSGNEPAVALYRRCGFQATGATRPNAHTSTLVEFEMTRNLE
jgi:GNAT superfamily N-acetyltransferase